MAGITHIAISINIQRPDEKNCAVLHYEMGGTKTNKQTNPKTKQKNPNNKQKNPNTPTGKI